MRYRHRAAISAIFGIFALPMVFGAECESVRIGTPFERIEYHQMCSLRADAPFHISIRRQEDDSYLMYFTDIKMVETDEECQFPDEFPIDGEGCYFLAQEDPRTLTAEEMQRVDEVLAALSAKYVFHPERIGRTCGFDICGPTSTNVNGHYFSDSGSCSPLVLELTDESRELIDALWQSFRD